MSNRTDFAHVATEWLDYEVTCSPAQRAALAPRLETVLHNAFVAGQEAEDRQLRFNAERDLAHINRLHAERERIVETTDLGKLSEELEADNWGSGAALVRSVMHERERMRAALVRAENVARTLFGSEALDREQIATELDAAVRGGLYPEDVP